MILRQSTAVTIVVGPFMDASDGVTPETGITLGAADQAEVLKAGGAATVDISGRTFTAITGADGFYHLSLIAGDVDTVGAGRIVIQDSSVCVPVQIPFQVIEEAVYDAFYASSADGQPAVTATDLSNIETDTQDIQSRLPAALVGGRMDSNVGAISGSTNAADNLEIVNDGNGSFVSLYSGFRGPGVYLDGGAANTNTTDGVDGTLNNPVSTIAAARTLAESLGYRRIYLVNDTNITLAAAHQNYEFVGKGDVIGNVINLGGQNVDSSLFVNLTVEGSQGGSSRIDLLECAIQDDSGVGDTTLNCFALRCLFVDRFQIDTSDDNVFDSCFSGAAGTAAPVIEATGSAGTINLRHYSGGIEFESLASSNNVSIEGDGNVIFNANCNVNANVVIRGNFTIVDNTLGMNNLTLGAAINREAINAEADTAISDANLATSAELAVVDANVDTLLGRITATLFSGVTSMAEWLGALAGSQTADATARTEIRATGAGSGTYDETTDSLQALRDRGDSAWATAVGFAVPGDAMTLQAGSVTAAVIATDAIDADALATDAVTEINAAVLAAITALNNLTAQEVRDAMKLAPTAGSPGSGSVDEHLDTIEGRVDVATSTRAAPGDAMTLAAAAITAAVIDTDAIDADALATDAVTEINAAVLTAISAVETDTQDIQTRLPAALVGGRMDSDVQAISGDSGAADRLEALMDSVIIAQVNGGTPTTTTFIADGFTEGTDDHFIGRLITFTSGQLNGQQTAITDYNGSTQEFTVDALTEAPQDDDFFVIH